MRVRVPFYIRSQYQLNGPVTSPPNIRRPARPAQQEGQLHAARQWMQGGYQPAPPPFAESAYPWPDEPPKGRARIWRRTLNFLAVFVVGALAGLAAAWWATRPVTPNAPPATAVASAAGASVARRDDSPNLPTLASDELPYDGVAPDGDAPLMPRLPYALESPPRASSDTSGSSPEADGKGKAGDGSPASPKDGTAPDKDEGEPKSSARGADEAEVKTKTDANSESTDAGEPKTVAAKPASTKDGSAKTAKRSADERVAAKSGEERKAHVHGQAATDTGPLARSGRPQVNEREDGEIARIRQQAADELWRKTVRERTLDQAGSGSRLALSSTMPPPSASSGSSTSRSVRNPAAVRRARLAQCEREPSLWEREGCRWKVCGGRWGEDGCPSYQNQNDTAPFN